MATDQEAIKIYLPAPDAQWLRAHAAREGRTLAGQIRKLVREHREAVESAAK